MHRTASGTTMTEGRLIRPSPPAPLPGVSGNTRHGRVAVARPERRTTTERATTTGRALIVDDEPHIRAVLRHWLSQAGYECEVADSAEAAVAELNRAESALLVTDIAMPGMSGMELLGVVKERWPDLAIIMVTAVDDRDTAIRALELGAYGYVIKPFTQDEILINVANAMERRRLVLASKAYEQHLEEQVRTRTAELQRRTESIALHLLSAAELRDDETGAHVRRIGLFSAMMAHELGWDGAAVEELRLAAPMHDIGKIGIPDTILRKPGPLDSRESDVMRTHTVIGARVLHDPDVPLLRLAAEVAQSHHERWDGSGYPEGLVGPAIPAAGRMVAILDVYDALTHDRVYRPAMPEDRALALMADGRGSHFDPNVFDCFMDCLNRFRTIRDELPETRVAG